eukprot:gene18174-19988_t
MDVLLVCLSLFGLWFPLAQAKRDQPHIILVTLRDLGWDDVSFHGNPEIPTPNIDRIANHGVILQEYYATPKCEESKAALKYGKYPIHYKQGELFQYDIWNYLDIQRYVIKEIGTIECDDTNIPFYPWDVVRQAEYVLRDHDQYFPLFLQVNFPKLQIDSPEQVPEEYIMRASTIPNESRRVYGAMVMELDRAIGHLVRLLYDTKILHDAVVIFTALTGATEDSNIYTFPSNYPLRGSNGTLWEGGSRSLGFVYSNRITNKARVSHGLMHITDWLPTFFGLAGGNPNHVVNGDGFNIWDVIDNEANSPRTEVLLGIYGDKGAMRMADYKIITNETFVSSQPRLSLKATPDSPTTIWGAELHCQESNDSIGCWPNSGPCLYNVREDPCEINNLAYYMPELVETFMFKLNEYNKTSKDSTRRRRSVEETILYQRTEDKLRNSQRNRAKNGI